MWVKLPLTGDAYQNVDEVEVDAFSATVQDAYINELGHTIKRPGLEEFTDMGTSAGIDGLFWWDEQQVAIVVSNGRVWKITDATGTKVELTGATMAVGARVTFATNGTILAMANGGRIVTTVLGGPLTVMADVDAPTAVTHVAFMDSYLLANNAGTGFFEWTDVGTMTAWTTVAFASAEGAPDNIVALHVGWQEVALVGRRSVEIWIDDGVTPFSRLGGAFIQSGTSAPYTFKRVGHSWMWLDENRRLVRLDARTPTPVSFPFDRVVQGLSTVDDAFADVMEIDGYPLYVITFPGSGKSMVYNYMKDKWSLWGYWNQPTATYNRWRGANYCYARNWNKHLVGDYANGLVYNATRLAYTDNGDTIRTMRRTGNITHGTMGRKRSYKLRVRCKRGVATVAYPSPQISVRWRDEDQQWGNEVVINMGATGDSYTFFELHGLGSYLTRQYEVIHTDPTEFILMEAEEDVEPLMV